MQRAFSVVHVMVCLGLPFYCHAQQGAALSWDWKNDQHLRSDETISRHRWHVGDRKNIQRALTKEFENFLAPEKPDPELISRIVSHSLVRIVHLNRDRSLQVLAQAGDLEGGCSPTGNCPIWIFRKVNSTYSPILNSHGQSFQVLENSNDAFADVVIGSHGSAFERELLIYRFNGEGYKETACFNAVFQQRDEAGVIQRPTVTKCR